MERVYCVSVSSNYEEWPIIGNSKRIESNATRGLLAC
jgi:hypothetical protein